MPTDESRLRAQFLDYVFDEREGFICLATGQPIKGRKDKFTQEFFKWPERKVEAIRFIEGARTKNVWFGVNLLSKPERIKENCLPHDIVWADLDTCHPSLLDPSPQVVIESSPDRYQALWKLDDDVPPTIAEEYARRIYSKYKINGVDSGWALTKLLRVPYTINYKYQSTPIVKIVTATDERIEKVLFENILIEELQEHGVEDVDMPDLDELPSPEMIIHEYRHNLSKTGFSNIYLVEPDEDWSAVLWQLIRICFEVGMTREEAFVVANSSKCNKYERDKRPLSHLWFDILKADTIDKTFSIVAGSLDDNMEFPELLTDQERGQIKENTFIDDYIKWASNVTDASKEYHEICGSIMLSSLLADKFFLNLRFGKVFPNLWGLVLGESTLTRKTTAMEMAMEFVTELDSNAILATQDSSAEGMLSALEGRPEKVSVYYRDEVAGFFDAMSSKSYLAGMPEVLTKLYDVPNIMVRQLSKKTVSVRRPVFIFFGGGIQDRVYETVNEEFFYSGFLPRFLVVNGEANIDQVQWMSPPSNVSRDQETRETLKTDLREILRQYQVQVIEAKIFGEDATLSKEIEALLTEDAWEKMQAIEQILVSTAHKSSRSAVALPTFSRMAMSLLKLSILFSAIRQEPKDFEIRTELCDVLKATHYIEKWAPHSIHMMMNVGTTTSERLIQKVLRMIRDTPGITRAEVMRRCHLQSVTAKIVFSTLEERGLINMKQKGRGYQIWAV